MAQQILIETGAYRVRLADSEADLSVSLALRARVFRDGRDDRDSYDERARHLLVEDRTDGALVASCRLLTFASGAGIGASYSARFYDLAGLGSARDAMVEIGRFCIAPERHDPDVLRLAWAGLARIVDAEGAGMLFGCTSFHGTEPELYDEAFALLAARHLAPRRWRPRIKATDVVHFGGGGQRREPDPRRAFKAMPPLLRSYLTMGGRVSDHAVIDRDLGTQHVFTGLEVRAVPPARARALRAMAGA